MKWKKVSRVTSWRRNTSAQAQEDLDELVGVCLEFAEQQLRAHSEFFPFAAGVRSSGEVEMIAVDSEVLGDRPSSELVLTACREAVASRGAALRAAAVAMDVASPDLGAGGVRVELQHVQGQALTVLLPYDRDGDQLVLGQLRASTGGRAGLRSA